MEARIVGVLEEGPVVVASAALRLGSDDVPADSSPVESDASQLVVAMRSCASDLSRDDEPRVSFGITVVLHIHEGLRGTVLVVVGHFSGRVRRDRDLLLIQLRNGQLVLLVGSSSRSWVRRPYPPVLLSFGR